MKGLGTTLVVVAGLTAAAVARAQPEDAETAEEASGGEGTPEPDPKGDPAPDQAAELKELKKQMAELRVEHDKLKVELEALERKQAETPSVIPPPAPPPHQQLTPTASVAFRHDSIFPPDPLGELATDPYIGGFRMRVRAGVEHTHADSAVIGEVRLALGQPLNPAEGFVPIGDAFRVAPVGLDRFWAAFRPFEDRRVVQLTAGKMPIPFWRGERFRDERPKGQSWHARQRGPSGQSELVWDDDVTPTGLALDIRFLEQSGVVVENTAALFVLHDIEDLRFEGLTGPAMLIADQLRIRWTYLTGAFAFYDYENLNTGLSAPGAVTTGGASTQPAANAFLMREGLQATNTRVSYGIGAAGFVREAFRIIQPSLAGHIPLPLDAIGKGSRLFMMVDYVQNLSVEADKHGIGGTAGIDTGHHDSGWIGPLSFWFTYRLVEADATLAAMADSNLGRGTDFRGFEIGARYEASRSVSLGVGYFDYLAAPAMDAQVRRFFAEIRWDY